MCKDIWLSNRSLRWKAINFLSHFSLEISQKIYPSVTWRHLITAALSYNDTKMKWEKTTDDKKQQF